MWNKRVAPAQAIQFIDSNSSVSNQEVLQYVGIKYGGIISLHPFLTVRESSFNMTRGGGGGQCRLTDQCSCPDSVHVSYMKFLAAGCRCELKVKRVCRVRKQNFLLIAELKGHEQVANFVITVLTLAIVFSLAVLARN